MERRRYPRVEVRFPAILRSDSHTIDAVVRNLGQGGVGLSAPLAEGAGTSGTVAMRLPGQDETLTFQGHISWSEEREGTHVMGFSFDGLSRDQRAAVANFILARFCSS